ncbi:hypothetical protein [Methylomonas lenta]|nr:hypothetical protein [Methylomonas lenta]
MALMFAVCRVNLPGKTDRQESVMSNAQSNLWLIRLADNANIPWHAL